MNWKEEIHMKYELKLFVVGNSRRSELAIANIRELCEKELNGMYELTVIDILEQPQLAEDEKILATPTLVKEMPSPARRIIGDLSDAKRVLFVLDLKNRTVKEMGDDN